MQRWVTIASLSVVVLGSALCPRPSAAQFDPWGDFSGGRLRTPVPVSPEKRLPGFRYSVGAGFAMLALSHGQLDGSATQQFGVGVDGSVGYRFNRWLAVNLVMLWGMTEWQRADPVVEAALAAGKWTSNAFVDVSEWMTEDVGRVSFLISSGWLAYPFLLMTYLAVPAVMMVSPFAATSFVATGPTVSAHYGNEALEGFVEAGAGGFFYFHPLDKGILAGGGPLFGAGLRASWFSFGARLLWSPRGAQSSVDGIDTNVFMLTTTARVVW